MTRADGVWLVVVATAVACVGGRMLVDGDRTAFVGDSEARRSGARPRGDGASVGWRQPADAEPVARDRVVVAAPAAAAARIDAGLPGELAGVGEVDLAHALMTSGLYDGDGVRPVRIKPVVPTGEALEAHGPQRAEAQAAVVLQRGEYLGDSSRDDSATPEEGFPATFESNYVIGNAHTPVDAVPGIPVE